MPRAALLSGLTLVKWLDLPYDFFLNIVVRELHCKDVDHRYLGDGFTLWCPDTGVPHDFNKDACVLTREDEDVTEADVTSLRDTMAADDASRRAFIEEHGGAVYYA